MSGHPTVKWAQRSDEVFITIELPDAQDVKLRLKPEGKFLFSATTGPDMDFGDFDFSKINMGGGEGFDMAEGEDDDDNDTEDETVKELSASKKDASLSGAAPEVKSV
ncbi:hypothetical protein F3Y22_tig00112498pilonHSYRG00009 [Hibiscus syriacus]|uniref:Co-chaperone protein p23 n=1 Tax=Hibiscus syriacus TaxID=106335 RepID=A0A6A2WY12_HIBSY|nr:hypothetical protein F3Y22_tig00112498pilonHSYRG00009 [Hibiscus syriacus]